MRGQGTIEKRVFIERRDRQWGPYGASFMMLNQRGLMEVSQRLSDHSMGMQSLRVLLAMMQHMDFENRVEPSQKDLAAMLEIDQSALSKACRFLMECGFVERMGTRRGWYRVSPKLCWKGSVKNLQSQFDKRAAA